MIKTAQRLLLPLGMGLSLWFLAVSLAMVGPPTKAQSPPVTGAAINRPQDPVIVNDNLAQHDNTPITRYGHCNFTTAEVLGAFVLLVDRVMNPPPYSPSFKHFLPLVLSKVN